MTMSQAMNLGTLADKANGWSQKMKDAATGPLHIAKEIVELSQHWDSYRSEAGDVTCTTWLSSQAFGTTERRSGWDLGWWQVRARAVEVIGESIRRTFHHEVAVYVLRSVPANKRDEIKTELIRQYHLKGKKPLTMGEAKRVISGIVGKKAKKPRVCQRCAELEAALARAGVPVPE